MSDKSKGFFKAENVLFAAVQAASLLLLIQALFPQFSSWDALIYAVCEMLTALSAVSVILKKRAGLICSCLFSLARIASGVVCIAGEDFPLGVFMIVSSIASVIISFMIFVGTDNGNSVEISEFIEETENESVEEATSGTINVKKQELYLLACVDELTGLFNPARLKEDAERLIQQDTPFSMIYVGLDNFNVINEAKGHEAGDEVLAEAARRISGAAADTDVCGRVGGDEFLIITRRHLSREECEVFSQQLSDSLCECFPMEDGTDVYLSASFGIAVYPEDGADYAELFKNANIALCKAKADGKHRYMLFDRNMQTEIEYHSRVAMLMHTALEKGEFYLVYQPQFFPDKRLRGFEALLRWKSEELGNVSPVAFIPIAEETGFIVTLGKWIMETACAKLNELTNRYGREILMSVNISSMQFMEKDFVQSIVESLDKTGANSAQLELEITESLLLSSVEKTSELLRQLKRMNIKVAIDDFGTGYSSLNYLRVLPIDTLKIDKSFIDALSEGNNGKNIVSTIIRLAHILNMTVTAEGVEYDEQLNYLSSNSCDCIQGFLFSKPLVEQDVDALMEAYAE